MAKLLRAAAWIVIGAIIVVSLVPPNSRLGTAVPHDLEHLMIFGFAGLAFGLGYRFGHFYQMIGIVVFAGAIELAQYSVAGRHARMSDFIVDATSACIGVIFGGVIHKTISRRRKNKGRTAVTERP
jgi:VanZ family protein